MAIPASQIVQVNPRLLAPGGTDLEFNGLLLSESSLIPSSQFVLPFPDPKSVGDYFGLESPEYAAAQVYFLGYNNSFKKPRALYVARRVAEAAPAWLRGGAWSGTLEELKTAGTGGLRITVNGETVTARNVSFAMATSYSDVGQILQSALNADQTPGQPAAPARLTGGAITLADLAPVKNGSFVIEIDGVAQHVSGLDLSAATSLPDIAAALTGKLEGVTIAADATGLVFTTTAVGAEATIGYAAAPEQTITPAVPGTAAVLQGGPVTLGGLSAVEDGALRIEVNGADVDLSGLDFRSASDIASVAAVLTAALPEKSGLVITGVTEGTEGTPVDRLLLTADEVGSAASIGFAQAPTSGTDVAGLLALTEATGAKFTPGTDAVPEKVSPDDLSALLALTEASGASAVSGTAAVEPSPAYGMTVTYSSLTKAWQITAPGTGAASSIGFAEAPESGVDMARLLNLTERTGAVLSQGMDAMSHAANMEAIRDLTENFVCFTTVDRPTKEDALALAHWASDQGVAYLYIYWDNDPKLLQPDNTATIAAALKEADVGATCGVWDGLPYAAMIMGTAASIDWDRRNGTITFAFKSQGGLPANVVTGTEATNLRAQNMNFMGDYATRNDQFIFMYPGGMFGEWTWIDTYLNAIWLNNALQVACMAGFEQTPRVPFTDEGYTLIRSWMQDPVNRALYSGIIDTGVTLSASQKAELTREAGRDISGELYTDGYV
ncbi:MAG: DUF3383 domain-containing protein, partial [Desulfovibrionaceae bacterium]|nr:DUF3383 domain-containing protein [Desulfovibrionaceae bacterium]